MNRGREQGENIGLQEGDEHFQEVDEQGEADGDGRDQEALENKDHADEGEDDNVPGPSCWHKGGRTGAKGLVNWPRISTGIMMGRSHAGRPCGNQVLQVVFEAVLLNAAPLDHGQCDERQGRGDGDVAGGSSAVGNKAQQIAEQNEEEGCQQETAGNAGPPRPYSAR